ncbi:hypothetical protein C1N55_13220 [Lysinibacillus sp. SGAir0095]|nr:hypothetical protein C1N55_13220 [Lysinibacillus sp. SGAir0095]
MSRTIEAKESSEKSTSRVVVDNRSGREQRKVHEKRNRGQWKRKRAVKSPREENSWTMEVEESSEKSTRRVVVDNRSGREQRKVREKRCRGLSPYNCVKRKRVILFSLGYNVFSDDKHERGNNNDSITV